MSTAPLFGFGLGSRQRAIYPSTGIYQISMQQEEWKRSLACGSVCASAHREGGGQHYIHAYLSFETSRVSFPMDSTRV